MPTSRSEPDGSRGQWRVWLKTAIESGALDRVPPLYEPLGVPTLSHARSLLADLRNPDAPGRPPAEVVEEVRAFRRWVEARQKRSRQSILSESMVEQSTVRFGLDSRISERAAPRPEKTPARPTPSTVRTRPQSNPMWDDQLDG